MTRKAQPLERKKKNERKKKVDDEGGKSWHHNRENWSCVAEKPSCTENEKREPVRKPCGHSKPLASYQNRPHRTWADVPFFFLLLFVKILIKQIFVNPRDLSGFLSKSEKRRERVWKHLKNTLNEHNGTVREKMKMGNNDNWKEGSKREGSRYKKKNYSSSIFDKQPSLAVVPMSR